MLKPAEWAWARPVTLATLVHGCARLGRSDATPLLSRVCAAAATSPGFFLAPAGKELAMLCWGLATLGHSDERLFKQVRRCCMLKCQIQ